MLNITKQKKRRALVHLWTDCFYKIWSDCINHLHNIHHAYRKFITVKRIQLKRFPRLSFNFAPPMTSPIPSIFIPSFRLGNVSMTAPSCLSFGCTVLNQRRKQMEAHAHVKRERELACISEATLCEFANIGVALPWVYPISYIVYRV